MAIKKHSSSARTRERSCWEGMRVRRWRTMRRQKKDERLIQGVPGWTPPRMSHSSIRMRRRSIRSMNASSPSPSMGWSSCPGSGSGSRPSRCPRWTPSSWDAFRWENQSNNDSATSASWNELRRKKRKQEGGGGGGGGKTYASMDLLRGHLSILAWKRMLAICKLRLSLSMAAVWLLGLGRGLAEYRLGGGGWWCHLLVGLQTAFRGLSSYFYPPTGGSTCCGTLSQETLS